VAPVPLLLDGLERFVGRCADQATANEIADTVAESVHPIDDVRGEASYKRLLLRQLVVAHFSAISGLVGTP
jgi:xanthine dehydrogenase small subunit